MSKRSLIITITLAMCLMLLTACGHPKIVGDDFDSAFDGKEFEELLDALDPLFRKLDDWFNV